METLKEIKNNWNDLSMKERLELYRNAKRRNPQASYFEIRSMQDGGTIDLNSSNIVKKNIELTPDEIEKLKQASLNVEIFQNSRNFTDRYKIGTDEWKKLQRQDSGKIDLVSPEFELLGAVGIKRLIKNLPELYYQKAPWTWKPNSNNYYRAGSKDMIDDAIESGIIRHKPSKSAYQIAIEEGRIPTLKERLDIGSRSGGNIYFSKGEPLSSKYGDRYGKTVSNYGDYIIETGNTSFKQIGSKGRNLKNDVFGNDIPFRGNAVPTEILNTSDTKLLKPNWFRGYTEINKYQDGGIINDDDIAAHYSLPEILVYPQNKFGDIARSQGINTARNWQSVKNSIATGRSEFLSHPVSQIVQAALPMPSGIEGVSSVIQKGSNVAKQLKPANRAKHAYVNISPASYTGKSKQVKGFVKDILSGKDANINKPKWTQSQVASIATSGASDDLTFGRFRDSAWKKYLGIPDVDNNYIQRYDGTFSYNLDNIPTKYQKQFVKLPDGVVPDQLTSAGGNVNKTTFKTNRYDVDIASLEDVWDLHPFSDPTRTALPSWTTKLDSNNNRIYKNFVPNKLKNLEVGKILGGKPFKNITNIPYKTDLKLNKIGDNFKYEELIDLNVNDIIYPVFDTNYNKIITETKYSNSYLNSFKSKIKNKIKKYQDGGIIPKYEISRNYLGRWLDNRPKQFIDNVDEFRNYSPNLNKGVDYWRNYQNDNLNSVEVVPFGDLSIDQRKSIQNQGAIGFYTFPDNKIWLDDIENMETALHEFTHALDAEPQEFKISKIIPHNDQYWDDPKEIYSRLMEFRMINNINPNKIFKSEDIKNIRKSLQTKDKQLLERYTDSQMLQLLNDVAYEDPIDNFINNIM